MACTARVCPIYTARNTGSRLLVGCLSPSLSCKGASVQFTLVESVSHPRKSVLLYFNLVKPCNIEILTHFMKAFNSP